MHIVAKQNDKSQTLFIGKCTMCNKFNSILYAFIHI